MTAVITPGLCYRVTVQERREKLRQAAASCIKRYHLKPPSLRCDVCDEFAHFARDTELGLATASTLVSPIYTLGNSCPIQLSSGSCEWRYRGRYLKGSLSGFIKYTEYSDSFTRLQLDVFHTFWDLYHLSQYRHRPAATSTSSERLTADRSHALQEVTIGIVVWRDYTDQKGRILRRRTKVYDLKLFLGEFVTPMETEKR